ncbi:MAG TPA: hypothetical protein PKX00_24160 [Opitutaceae bacterium]|nr:hypothetical protein [Opitutaceae bacterium]
MKALLVTLFWGGPGGQRPLFVLTHPPRTSPAEHRDTGRGIGKTTVCELMAKICGGYVDISGSARSEDIEKRLLSPAAFGKRMVRFDNIKSSRFACEDFERMITSSTLSGRRLYVGEGQRPNLLTYVLTMNGVALGDDLASRSVVIHLARPVHCAGWREGVERFIERHRWELIAEIGSILETPPTPLSTHSRFGAWEAAVLSKLANPDELVTLLRERSQQIDVDRDTAEMIEHEFRARCGSWISATEPITIGSTEASEIIFAVTGEKIPANRLKAYFERIGFSGVRYRRTNRRAEWTIPRQFPERSGTPPGPGPSRPVPGINGPSPEPPTMTGE